MIMTDISLVYSLLIKIMLQSPIAIDAIQAINTKLLCKCDIFNSNTYQIISLDFSYEMKTIENCNRNQFITKY